MQSCSPNPGKCLNDQNKSRGKKLMREKCHDYLKKPTATKLADLTTMEQQWCAAQAKAADGKEKKPK